MSFPPIIPILRIFDQTIAKTFYVDFLGFHVDWEHQFGDNFPKYMQISKGHIIIHLSEHYGDASPGSSIRIFCEDLVSLHQNLTDKQHTNVKPHIEEKPWQMSEMSITDPFHNRLIFWKE